MTAPALAVATPDGRGYRHPKTGETAISVTTAISSLAKPFLIPWAAKMAAEYAVKNWDSLAVLDADERITDIKDAHKRRAESAADIGDTVHEAIDAYASGEHMPLWDKAIAGHMRQFEQFLAERNPTFIQTEVTVWNRTLGYAGTFDWLAFIGDHLTLGDTKTGKGVYPEVALQLTALAHGEFIIHPDGREEPMPEVDLLGVLHVRPRSWALIPVARSEETWRAFQAALELTKWQRDTAPDVLGARLREVRS